MLCCSDPAVEGAKSSDKLFRTNGSMRIPPTSAHWKMHMPIDARMVLRTQSTLFAPKAFPTLTQTATERPKENMNMNPIIFEQIVCAITFVCGSGSNPAISVRNSKDHHSVATIAYAGTEMANSLPHPLKAAFRFILVRDRIWLGLLISIQNV
mmetsp:Transcript_41376/g.67254  ORF Transcript_41376/g.67254 Transcript_41376/m.67254 type:complete len:153 (+) Transcript_41376:989-1447(+)